MGGGEGTIFGVYLGLVGGGRFEELGADLMLRSYVLGGQLRVSDFGILAIVFWWFGEVWGILVGTILWEKTRIGGVVRGW